MSCAQKWSHCSINDYSFILQRLLWKRVLPETAVGEAWCLVILQLVIHSVNLAFSCHFITCQIFVVGGNFIDHHAVRQDFHNAVGSRLDELMIVRGKQNNAGELHHAGI